ncbi:hypothetical protein INT48_005733 [Thamnidium elegans]|uniref:Uncharacterized protein n=1 Tax=Thamnidium elegans TaxID=101142 RepID=A0A8H7VTE2_9FUNG|nr:hypothetical protein INT48_005733 [Thamnidium elegans]
MKFFTISAILALVACASAVPAGHMDLAKRSIIATNTIVKDGSTYYEVINLYTSVKTDTTTLVDTVTQTHTDVSYIYAYSGTDTAGIISRLQKGLSGIIDPAGPSSSSSSDSSSSSSSSDSSSSDSSSSDSSSSASSSSSSSDSSSSASSSSSSSGP